MIFDFRLHVFHTVARRLSFTKAAEELFITQPAITKHIRALEQQLKTKLFERRGNSIALTPAGTLLLHYAIKLEHIYSNLEQDISSLNGNLKGNLTIGASTTIAQYLLPPILSNFRQKYPDISLAIISGNTEQIEQALLSGSIDLGFIEGTSKNKQIKYLLFANDELVLVGKAKQTSASKMPVKIPDLKSMKFVMREPGSGTLEVIISALKKAGIKWQDVNIELQLDSTEAIKSYLTHSDCFAFISAAAITKKQAKEEFRIIPVKDLIILRPLSAIYLQGEAPQLAATFLKFALHYNQK